MDRQLYNDLKMFWGAISETAKRSNVSEESVRFVLRDARWNNDKIRQNAQEVLQERKEKMRQLLNG